MQRGGNIRSLLSFSSMSFSRALLSKLGYTATTHIVRKGCKKTEMLTPYDTLRTIIANVGTCNLGGGTNDTMFQYDLVLLVSLYCQSKQCWAIGLLASCFMPRGS